MVLLDMELGVRYVLRAGGNTPTETPTADRTSICIAPRDNPSDVLTVIKDPKTSGLDLIPSNLCKIYRNFSWDPNDFPGAPSGPNEKMARQIALDLTNYRPEHRPNTGHYAIITSINGDNDPKWH